MEEIWKIIKGWEHYEVSSLGRVRSIEYSFVNKAGRFMTIKSTMLKGDTNDRGYVRYLLHSRTVKRRKVFGQRLVAEAFVPNPENKPQVNHINSIKADNSACNLEWCTPSENKSHWVGSEFYSPKFGESSPHPKLTNEDVLKIRELRKTTHMTCKAIGALFGIQHSQVSRITSGKRWPHI